MRAMILVGFLLAIALTVATAKPEPATAVRACNAIGQGDVSPAVSARTFTAKHRIRITENRGQIVDTDGNLRPDMRYHADAGGAQLYFTHEGISLVFTQRGEMSVSEASGRPAHNGSGRHEAGLGEERSTMPVRHERVDMMFAGANPDALLVTDEVLEGYANYYYGHCPDGITQVPSHGRLTYRNIYNNIDFVFTTDVGRCKYEFVVRPGGKVEDIRLRYTGARDIAFTTDGGLEISAAFGGVRESAPLTYQEKGMEIPSTFMLNGNEVGFMVGAYDPSQDLVIDPWATYYGGSGSDDAFGVATDGYGSVVVCGSTSGGSFPVYNAYQGATAGGQDAVVVKFDGFGSLLWATYYGGSGVDLASDVATDGSGSIFIAGHTASANFPVQGPQQAAYAGGSYDAFVLKFNGSGVLQWASYYGGSLSEQAKGIATDSNGDVVFGGWTESSDLTVLNAYQGSNAGARDVFIAKFSGSGVLQWATYLGGTAGEAMNVNNNGGGVDTDHSGNVFVTGSTSSLNFPLLNAFQTTGGGNATDAFVTSLSSGGTMRWSTYYGGSSPDVGIDVASLPNGDVAVSGRTGSTDLPTQNAHQGTYGGGSFDGFVLMFDGNGLRKWATYLGGASSDMGLSIASDGNGNVSISGHTASTNFPVLNAFQGSKPGGLLDAEIFISQFSSSGALQWSTYYGGTGDDNGGSVAVDGSGNVVVAARCYSFTMPVYSAWQATTGGPRDIFVIHFSPSGAVPVELISFSASASDGRVQLKWRTESETNNHGFSIERSRGTTPRVWSDIGFVPGHGTSLVACEYSFVDDLADAPPGDAQYWYRLRQRDFDGSTEYSPVVMVSMRGQHSPGELLLYPNPAMSQATVTFELSEAGVIDISVYDLLGREVYGLVRGGSFAAGRHSVVVPLSGLRPGPYFLQLASGGTRRQTPLLVSAP